MGLELGDTIDNKYRIVRLLGEGGMGAVYEGENTRIHRRVAIKILHSNVASSEDAVRRFEREAQAAGRIGSEHIVEVIDLGDLPDGDRYMVMEYLDGVALNDRIKEVGKLSPEAIASIVIGLLEGLSAAHDAGIVHRDLKPDNVFLLASKGDKKDFVKIVDFGISKFNTAGEEFSMTRTGTVMGTPYYLSPEQAKGQRNLDHRADLYAVGVILYEATVGNVPFDGETFNELLFKIVMDPLPSLKDADPEMDPHFIAIVEKGMARDPDQRFQSAAEMKEALLAWLSGQSLDPELAKEAAAARLSSTEVLKATNTPGAWANTQVGEAAPALAPAGSKKTLLLAAAALLLAGGGAFFAYNSKESSEAATRAAQEDADLLREEAAQERSQEVSRLQAEQARAKADLAQAEQAKSEAERATAEVKSEVLEREKKRSDDEKAVATAAEEERLAANRRAAARRRKNEGSSAKPATKESSSKSGGRSIRTEF